MRKEFQQITWDKELETDCRQLMRLAIREDVDRRFDITTVALIEPGAVGRAQLVARQSGVVCGLRACRTLLDEMEIRADWSPSREDGDSIAPGGVLAAIAGPARDLLTAERLLLNFVGRLSGIATWTRQYVDRVAGTQARIYDTRKTTPGWRRLEKYAVRCGGGHNHRLGLFDAVLIKDNHLAHVTHAQQGRLTPAQAVAQARARLHTMDPAAADKMIVEVEVDSLGQFAEVLPERPDIILLDNMTLEQMREAVSQRDASGLAVELEASGGVTLDRIASIAATGVDRISVGALTHSAINLDVGLDWATDRA